MPLPKKVSDSAGGIMSRRVSFGDIARALRETEWIDDVVLALSKAEHGVDLSAKDAAVLGRAVEFLEDVKSGSQWLQEETPVIDPDSRRTISSFVMAADSFGASRSKERFFEDLDTLLETARTVPSSRIEDPKRLTNLRKFFSNVLGTSLQNIDAAFSSNPFLPPTFVPCISR